jgi:hypothetical protein
MMTNKKPTFTVLTTLTALVGLTALMTTASLIPASQVQARPPLVNAPVNTPVIPAYRLPGQSPVYTPKTPIQAYISTIQGKINSNDPSSSQVSCSQITIELNESIPTQQIPGTLGSNPIIDRLSQVIATGSNLASGCTYTIMYGGDGKPVRHQYGYSSYRINVASTGSNTNSGGWFGGQGFKAIPRVADLSMAYSSGLH